MENRKHSYLSTVEWINKLKEYFFLDKISDGIARTEKNQTQFVRKMVSNFKQTGQGSQNVYE